MYHGRFSGSHYDAGYKYGSLIKKNGIKLNKSPTYKIDSDRINFAKECVKIYNKYYPEIIEEIKGISDGNEADFDFISALIFSMYCYEVKNRCSCFAFKNKDSIIFGRNSDFLTSIEKLNMNVLYKLNNSYSFNGNTTAFVEIEDGINEYGLSIGLTFVATKIVKPGFNAGILIRYLLEKCRSVDEAIKKINNLPIGSAQTLTIADRNGKLVVIECNAFNIEIIYPKKDYIYSTNIFVSKAMEKYNIDSFDNWNAKERYQTFENSFKKNYRSIKFAKNLLSGKYGFMCQYDRKKGADTVWSIIYDISKNKIYRAEGNPSRKEYKEDKRFKFFIEEKK